MSKEPANHVDAYAALLDMDKEQEAVIRAITTRSTYYQPTTELPPVGTLLRVKVDCNVSVYDLGTVLADVPVKAGDVGIVESHGAIVDGRPCIARVRLFRIRQLAGVSRNSLSNGARWEVFDG